jgi:hypothetical protein
LVGAGGAGTTLMQNYVADPFLSVSLEIPSFLFTGLAIPIPPHLDYHSKKKDS